MKAVVLASVMLALVGCGDDVESVVFGPVTLPAGQEYFLCQTFHLPSGRSTARRLTFSGMPDIVEATLYQRTDDVPDDVYPCETVSKNWTQLMTVTEPTLDLTFPPQVQMLSVRRAQFALQIHYKNAAASDAKVQAQLDLHNGSGDDPLITASTTSPNRTIEILPGDANRVATHDCLFNAPATVYALAAVIGDHVTGINVHRINSDNTTGDLLYHHEGRDRPPFLTLPAPITTMGTFPDTATPGQPPMLGARDGLRITCTFDDTATAPLLPGPRLDRDALCSAIFYSYQRGDASSTLLRCAEPGMW